MGCRIGLVDRHADFFAQRRRGLGGEHVTVERQATERLLQALVADQAVQDIGDKLYCPVDGPIHHPTQDEARGIAPCRSVEDVTPRHALGHVEGQLLGEPLLSQQLVAVDAACVLASVELDDPVLHRILGRSEHGENAVALFARKQTAPHDHVADLVHQVDRVGGAFVQGDCRAAQVRAQTFELFSPEVHESGASHAAGVHVGQAGQFVRGDEASLVQGVLGRLAHQVDHAVGHGPQRVLHHRLAVRHVAEHLADPSASVRRDTDRGRHAHVVLDLALDRLDRLVVDRGDDRLTICPRTLVVSAARRLVGSARDFLGVALVECVEQRRLQLLPTHLAVCGRQLHLFGRQGLGLLLGDECGRDGLQLHLIAILAGGDIQGAQVFFRLGAQAVGEGGFALTGFGSANGGRLRPGGLALAREGGLGHRVRSRVEPLLLGHCLLEGLLDLGGDLVRHRHLWPRLDLGASRQPALGGVVGFHKFGFERDQQRPERGLLHVLDLASRDHGLDDCVLGDDAALRVATLIEADQLLGDVTTVSDNGQAVRTQRSLGHALARVRARADASGDLVEVRYALPDQHLKALDRLGPATD